MDNANSPEYLNKIKNTVIENLSRTRFRPSMQMTDVPRENDEEVEAELDDADEDDNKDERYTTRRWDKRIDKDGEFSDSEDEDENERNGIPKQIPGGLRRMNIMDYQNPDAVADDDSRMGSPTSASLNGDASTSANGEVHEKLLGTKGSLSPAADSDDPDFERRSDVSLASKDSHDFQGGDVEMKDDAGPAHDTEQQLSVASGHQRTPPSLLNDEYTVTWPDIQAAVPPDVDMREGDGPDDPSIAKAQGISERTEADTNAEAAAEFAKFL